MGFWKYAQEDPGLPRDRRPRRHRARRRRRARPRQPGRARAARRSACSRATRSRRCCPTASHPLHALPRRAAGGLLLRADQLPAVSAPEIAYILQDSEAKAFVSHERFADARRARRPTRPASRPSARLAHGTIPGFRSFDELVDAQPTDAARRPLHRRGDALHVGHHRQAEGREARARRHRSRHRAPSCSRSCCSCSASCPATANVHLSHVAELPHRGHDVRGQLAAHEAHRRVHGQVGRRRRRCGSSSATSCTHTHMVPTQFIRMLQLPDDVKAEVRRVVDEVGDPRGGAVPGRHQAQDARLVGPGDLGVLRRDRRRRHDRAARRVAEVPRHRRPGVADRAS